MRPASHSAKPTDLDSMQKPAIGLSNTASIVSDTVCVDIDVDHSLSTSLHQTRFIVAIIRNISLSRHHSCQTLVDAMSLSERRDLEKVDLEKDALPTWRSSSPAQNHSLVIKPTQRLAYLDGLRGVSALLVYVLHYQVFGHTPIDQVKLEAAFGEAGHHVFAALPFVRIIFTGGHLAVCIFFVISGYVLASSPLRSIHAGNTQKLFDSVSSALFRRWVRLFVPVAVTTFLWMASWHLLGVKSIHKPERTLYDECWKWYYDFKNFSFIYTGNHLNSYNFHAWSIALEFRGSIVVYSALLALRKCSTNKRLICEATLVWYFMYIVDGWYCSLFMAGVLLCDLDMLAETNALPSAFRKLRSVQRWIYPMVLIVGLYLGGVPSVVEEVKWLRTQPGWYWLSFMKPQAVLDVRFYFRSIGAVLLMIAVRHISCLKRFFETTPCQYLGRISYAFYLVHGPILWSLGDRLYAASGRVQPHHIDTSPKWINYWALPDAGPWGMEVNLVAPHLILLPFTLWMAEIGTRTIDEPSVRLAQWLWRWATDDDGDETSATKGKVEQ